MKSINHQGNFFFSIWPPPKKKNHFVDSGIYQDGTESVKYQTGTTLIFNS